MGTGVGFWGVVEDGDVVSVVRQRYMVKGRLVRPALVVVAFDE